MARKPTVFALLMLALASACGEPTILVPDSMRVVSVAPSHGAVRVAVDVSAFIFLSHQPDDPDAAEAAVSLNCLGSPDEDRGCNAPVAAGCPPRTQEGSTTTFDSGGQFIRLTPMPDLQANTCYVIVVDAGVAANDPNTAALPVTVRSAFRTAAP